MFKLESANRDSISENIKLDYPEVNIKNFFLSNLWYFFICYQDKKIDDAVEQIRKPLNPAANVSLQPIMSDSLGNYEPKDLPVRTGPGEGGKRKFKYKTI